MRFQRKGKRIGLVKERQSLKKQKLDYQYKFIVKRILLQLFLEQLYLIDEVIWSMLGYTV